MDMFSRRLIVAILWEFCLLLTVCEPAKYNAENFIHSTLTVKPYPTIPEHEAYSGDTNDVHHRKKRQESSESDISSASMDTGTEDTFNNDALSVISSSYQNIESTASVSPQLSDEDFTKSVTSTFRTITKAIIDGHTKYLTLSKTQYYYIGKGSKRKTSILLGGVSGAVASTFFSTFTRKMGTITKYITSTSYSYYFTNAQQNIKPTSAFETASTSEPIASYDHNEDVSAAGPISDLGVVTSTYISTYTNKNAGSTTFVTSTIFSLFYANFQAEHVNLKLKAMDEQSDENSQEEQNLTTFIGIPGAITSTFKSTITTVRNGQTQIITQTRIKYFDQNGMDEIKPTPTINNEYDATMTFTYTKEYTKYVHGKKEVVTSTSLGHSVLPRKFHDVKSNAESSNDVSSTFLITSTIVNRGKTQYHTYTTIKNIQAETKDSREANFESGSQKENTNINSENMRPKGRIIDNTDTVINIPNAITSTRITTYTKVEEGKTHTITETKYNLYEKNGRGEINPTAAIGNGEDGTLTYTFFTTYMKFDHGTKSYVTSTSLSFSTLSVEFGGVTTITGLPNAVESTFLVTSTIINQDRTELHTYTKIKYFQNSEASGEGLLDSQENVQSSIIAQNEEIAQKTDNNEEEFINLTGVPNAITSTQVTTYTTLIQDIISTITETKLRYFDKEGKGEINPTASIEDGDDGTLTFTYTTTYFKFEHGKTQYITSTSLSYSVLAGGLGDVTTITGLPNAISSTFLVTSTIINQDKTQYQTYTKIRYFKNGQADEGEASSEEKSDGTNNEAETDMEASAANLEKDVINLNNFPNKITSTIISIYTKVIKDIVHTITETKLRYFNKEEQEEINPTVTGHLSLSHLKDKGKGLEMSGTTERHITITSTFVTNDKSRYETYTKIQYFMTGNHEGEVMPNKISNTETITSTYISTYTISSNKMINKVTSTFYTYYYPFEEDLGGNTAVEEADGTTSILITSNYDHEGVNDKRNIIYPDRQSSEQIRPTATQTNGNEIETITYTFTTTYMKRIGGSNHKVTSTSLRYSLSLLEGATRKEKQNVEIETSLAIPGAMRSTEVTTATRVQGGKTKKFRVTKIRYFAIGEEAGEIFPTAALNSGDQGITSTFMSTFTEIMAGSTQLVTSTFFNYYYPNNNGMESDHASIENIKGHGERDNDFKASIIPNAITSTLISIYTTLRHGIKQFLTQTRIQYFAANGESEIIPTDMALDGTMMFIHKTINTETYDISTPLLTSFIHISANKEMRGHGEISSGNLMDMSAIKVLGMITSTFVNTQSTEKNGKTMYLTRTRIRYFKTGDRSGEIIPTKAVKGNKEIITSTIVSTHETVKSGITHTETMTYYTYYYPQNMLLQDDGSNLLVEEGEGDILYNKFDRAVTSTFITTLSKIENGVNSAITETKFKYYLTDLVSEMNPQEIILSDHATKELGVNSEIAINESKDQIRNIFGALTSTFFTTITETKNGKTNTMTKTNYKYYINNGEIVFNGEGNEGVITSSFISTYSTIESKSTRHITSTFYTYYYPKIVTSLHFDNINIQNSDGDMNVLTNDAMIDIQPSNNAELDIQPSTTVKSKTGEMVTYTFTYTTKYKKMNHGKTDIFTSISYSYIIQENGLNIPVTTLTYMPSRVGENDDHLDTDSSILLPSRVSMHDNHSDTYSTNLLNSQEQHGITSSFVSVIVTRINGSVSRITVTRTSTYPVKLGRTDNNQQIVEIQPSIISLTTLMSTSMHETSVFPLSLKEEKRDRLSEVHIVSSNFPGKDISPIESSIADMTSTELVPFHSITISRSTVTFRKDVITVTIFTTLGNLELRTIGPTTSTSGSRIYVTAAKVTSTITQTITPSNIIAQSTLTVVDSSVSPVSEQISLQSSIPNVPLDLLFKNLESSSNIKDTSLPIAIQPISSSLNISSSFLSLNLITSTSKEQKEEIITITGTHVNNLEAIKPTKSENIEKGPDKSLSTRIVTSTVTLPAGYINILKYTIIGNSTRTETINPMAMTDSPQNGNVNNGAGIRVIEAPKILAENIDNLILSSEHKPSDNMTLAPSFINNLQKGDYYSTIITSYFSAGTKNWSETYILTFADTAAVTHYWPLISRSPYFSFIDSHINSGSLSKSFITTTPSTLVSTSCSTTNPTDQVTDFSRVSTVTITKTFGDFICPIIVGPQTTLQEYGSTTITVTTTIYGTYTLPNTLSLSAVETSLPHIINTNARIMSLPSADWQDIASALHTANVEPSILLVKETVTESSIILDKTPNILGNTKDTGFKGPVLQNSIDRSSESVFSHTLDQPSYCGDSYPECDNEKLETCQEFSLGKSKCVCHIGYARREQSAVCIPIKTYSIRIPVTKLKQEHLVYNNKYHNPSSEDYKKMASLAKQGLDETMAKSIKYQNSYYGSNILNISNPKEYNSSLSDGLLLNYTIAMAPDDALSLSDLEENMNMLIVKNNFSIGDSELIMDHSGLSIRDKMTALNMCDDERLNDCDKKAFCENLNNSFKCHCNESKGVSDLGTLPGRICGFTCPCTHGGSCNGTAEDGTIICICPYWWFGYRCQYNGLALAIALPLIFGVLLLICLIILCCFCFGKTSTKTKSPTKRTTYEYFGRVDTGAIMNDHSSDGSAEAQKLAAEMGGMDNYTMSKASVHSSAIGAKSQMSDDRSGFNSRYPAYIIPRAKYSHDERSQFSLSTESMNTSQRAEAVTEAHNHLLGVLDKTDDVDKKGSASATNTLIVGSSSNLGAIGTAAVAAASAGLAAGVIGVATGGNKKSKKENLSKSFDETNLHAKDHHETRAQELNHMSENTQVHDGIENQAFVMEEMHSNRKSYEANTLERTAAAAGIAAAAVANHRKERSQDLGYVTGEKRSKSPHNTSADKILMTEEENFYHHMSQTDKATNGSRHAGKGTGYSETQGGKHIVKGRDAGYSEGNGSRYTENNISHAEKGGGSRYVDGNNVYNDRGGSKYIEHSEAYHERGGRYLDNSGAHVVERGGNRYSEHNGPYIEKGGSKFSESSGPYIEKGGSRFSESSGAYVEKKGSKYSESNGAYTDKGDRFSEKNGAYIEKGSRYLESNDGYKNRGSKYSESRMETSSPYGKKMINGNGVLVERGSSYAVDSNGHRRDGHRSGHGKSGGKSNSENIIEERTFQEKKTIERSEGLDNGGNYYSQGYSNAQTHTHKSAPALHHNSKYNSFQRDGNLYRPYGEQEEVMHFDAVERSRRHY